jgi:hypothetical protein
MSKLTISDIEKTLPRRCDVTQQHLPEGFSKHVLTPSKTRQITAENIMKIEYICRLRYMRNMFSEPPLRP